MASNPLAAVIQAPPRRFRLYPESKASGLDWLGEIPSSWEVAPLYGKYDVALGKMLDEKRITGKHLAPYLRNVDVQWDRVNIDDLPMMDFPPEEGPRFSLKPGDLLVCEGGEVGRTAIWRGELPECYYQKAIHRLRPHDESQHPRFILYVMYAAAQLGVFIAGSNANTIDHLTAVKLRHHRFPFPPKPEQQAIAAFLDGETAKIDALVAKKERVIELLKEKRTALITQAVTKGLDPNVQMKDSGVEWLGEIPAHWGAVRVKSITAEHKQGFYTEQAYVDDGVKLARITDIDDDGNVSFANMPFVQITKEAELEFGIREGDFLFARSGTIGRFGIVRQPERAVFASYLIRFRFAAMDLEFLRYAFGSRCFRESLISSLHGGANENVHAENIKERWIAVPPLPEQALIAKFLDGETTRLDALIRRVRDAIDHLRELRTALISVAVTGKIDVREGAA